jgi:hypothetical protein
MEMIDPELTSRELNREKAWSRIYLVPMLLAEQDRDAYRRQQASIARETEIMKDVPGWEVGLASSTWLHFFQREYRVGMDNMLMNRLERAYTTPRGTRRLPLRFCKHWRGMYHHCTQTLHKCYMINC